MKWARERAAEDFLRGRIRDRRISSGSGSGTGFLPWVARSSEEFELHPDASALSGRRTHARAALDAQIRLWMPSTTSSSQVEQARRNSALELSAADANFPQR